MITIKAWTSYNKLIEWTYDNPQQAAPAWKKITETGRSHDTHESLTRAYYYSPLKPGRGPDKAWAA